MNIKELDKFIAEEVSSFTKAFSTATGSPPSSTEIPPESDEEEADIPLHPTGPQKINFVEKFKVPFEKKEKIEKWGNFKFENLKHLGQGSQGDAWEFNSDYVVKITLDETEADSSSYLIGEKHLNATKYFKVAEVKTDAVSGFGAPYSHSIYLIIQEKLHQADEFYSANVVDALHRLLQSYDFTTTDAMIYEKRQENEESVRDFLSQPSGFPLDNEENKQIINIMQGVFDGLAFLDMNDIFYTDVWLPNLLFRNRNTPVIIDLGYSASPHAGQIDVLELKRKKYKKS